MPRLRVVKADAVLELLVESLANPVHLRRFHLGFGVINVVDRHEDLKVAFVDPPAIFGVPVGHDPKNPVIEQIGGVDRRLGGVELGMGHLGISSTCPKTGRAVFG